MPHLLGDVRLALADVVEVSDDGAPQIVEADVLALLLLNRRSQPASAPGTSHDAGGSQVCGASLVGPEYRVMPFNARAENAQLDPPCSQGVHYRRRDFDPSQTVRSLRRVVLPILPGSLDVKDVLAHVEVVPLEAQDFPLAHPGVGREVD